MKPASNFPGRPGNNKFARLFIKGAFAHVFRYFLSCMVIGLSLLIPVGHAGAEEPALDLYKLSLEELMDVKVATVYGASRHGQKTAEAPSSVTVITADDIKKLGYRTLGDILRSARSFYTYYDRSYLYAGVRGFGLPGDYSSRLLILIDGHRTNDNVYLAGYIGNDLILDVDLIERVEIIRGPGSSLYGTNAFFGVVNIITRRAKTVNGLEVSGETGSLGTTMGRLTYGNEWPGGAELLLSASAFDSEGQELLYFEEFDDPATNNGIAENADQERACHYYSRLSFGSFTLHGGYVNREKRAPTGAFDVVFNDTRNSDHDRRGFAELIYERNFSDTGNVMARVSYDDYRYLWTGIFDMAEEGDEPDLVVNHDKAHGQWWSGELKFITRLSDSNILTAGAEYQDNTKQNLSNYDEEPREIYSDIRQEFTNWALYAQEEITLPGNFILNAGARYDYYESFGGTVNPRAALIFTPKEETTFKLLYGRAFRAPNIFELYFESEPSSQKSNPDMDPETIDTYEAVLEQSLGKHFQGTVAAFYNRLDNLVALGTDPVDGYDAYMNIGSYEVRGAEFELAGRWAGGLETRLSYTYQDAENAETGDDLPNSPKHLAKANLVVPLIPERVFAAVEFLYTGPRETLDDNQVDPYYLTNLTFFTRNVIKGLEISAGIYNLFDNAYSEPASEESLMETIEQDGRTIRLKATCRF